MPLYEYECDACGHRFEVIQKHSDPPADKCPVCGGAVHKLQSAPAFQFKGSGWYVTDYAKKDGAKAEKTDGASADARAEKKDKADKAEKAEKADKSEKAGDKSEKAGKKEKSASPPTSTSS
jgi:putative FmdB family regulatory protein